MQPGAGAVLRPREVIWREVSGEMVILDQDGGRIFGLNASGGHMWRLLDGRRSLTDIAAELASHFAIPHERAERDVVALAGQLVDRGLADIISRG
ncbi:MAG TPA: PqqD family protein [Kofleriaceae bacterium]|nr:PqqD family protein [Kofleriaceae bacterium]